jgi:tight junction protein 1
LTFRKAHLSSKKLLEQCQKLEKLWTHVYTGTLNLTSVTTEGQWYSKLTDLIEKQQTAPIWMSETKVIKITGLPFEIEVQLLRK